MGYKFKRILAWTGISLAALIAVGLIVRAAFNYTNGKKLERVLDEMKSKGVPLTLQELEPKCDPGENAAVGWKTAEAILSIDDENKVLLSKVIDDLFSGRPLKNKDLLSNLVKKNRDAIQLILDASNKSCFKYEEKWEGPGYDPRIPSAIKMIQATRLMGIDAYLKAEEGRIEEAIDRCLAARRFLRLYLKEPSLINYLVATACTKQVAVCFQKIVADREIKTDTLKKILKEWDSYPWKEGLVWSLKSEKVIGLENMLLYLKGERDLDLGRSGKIYYWIFRPVFKTEIIWLLGSYDLMLKAAEMPYYASRDSEELEQRTNRTPQFYIMSHLFIPNAVTVLFKKATLEAAFETARVGIACKIYKNLHGKFPDSLAGLSPEIMETIPFDPFTGHPLIYKKQDSGILVYSVGSNLKDDGGNGTWQITSLVMEKDDDWTWKEGTGRK